MHLLYLLTTLTFIYLTINILGIYIFIIYNYYFLKSHFIFFFLFDVIFLINFHIIQVIKIEIMNYELMLKNQLRVIRGVIICI